MCHVWDCQLKQWQNLPLLIFFNALISRFNVHCCTSDFTALLSFLTWQNLDQWGRRSLNEQTPLSDWYLDTSMEHFFKLLVDVGGHSSLWAVPSLYRCPELYKNRTDQPMGSKSVSSISLCWFSPPNSCFDFLPWFLLVMNCGWNRYTNKPFLLQLALCHRVYNNGKKIRTMSLQQNL